MELPTKTNQIYSISPVQCAFNAKASSQTSWWAPDEPAASSSWHAEKGSKCTRRYLETVYSIIWLLQMFPFPPDTHRSLQFNWDAAILGTHSQGVIGGHDILYWPAPRSAQDTATDRRRAACSWWHGGGETITYIWMMMCFGVTCSLSVRQILQREAS